MNFISGARIPLKQEEFTGEDTARFYDEHARRFMQPVYRRFAAKAANIRLNGKRILDTGTGTGCLAIELAKSRPNWQITGIDVSEDMLKVARKNAARETMSDRIDFKPASVAALPFADGHFHLVVSNASLHLWPDPVEALREMARVTAPGGYCLIWDNMRLRIFTPLLSLLGRTMGMNAAQRRLWMRAIQASYTAGEAKAFLKKSPLINARLEIIPAFMYMGICWQNRLSDTKLQ
jgi:ubiquinone/menaquinone biosynthesis C-methylase UbiE